MLLLRVLIYYFRVHEVCSNTEDSPPLSTIEPVIYSTVVRKNDTKVTVKISTFVNNIDTS